MDSCHHANVEDFRALLRATCGFSAGLLRPWQAVTASEGWAGSGKCRGTMGVEYTFEICFSVGFLLCSSEAAMDC